MKRLFCVLVALACLGAKPIRPISIDARDWQFEFSNGMPPHPSPLQGVSGWYFQFPADAICGGSPCSVNYLTTRSVSNLTGKMALSAAMQTVVVSGAPVFNYRLESGNTCDYPAHARFIIEANSRGMVDAYSHDRWWSNPVAYQLDTFDAQVITAPLTPDQWSSVFGEFGNASAAAQTDFALALKTPNAVGLTFGGGCFFGHGVNTQNGVANFLLTAIQAQ